MGFVGKFLSSHFHGSRRFFEWVSEAGKYDYILQISGAALYKELLY